MSSDPEPTPFGIGCLYFVPAEPVSGNGWSTRYKALIRAALEAIPNVNNLVIEGGEDAYLLGAPLPLHVPDYAPYPLRLKIEFDLYIPARIQGQLLVLVREGFVGSEHFHVKLAYDLMPLAMVTATEPGGWRAGSDYIVLVRNYLERELDKSVVALSSLGPSPFHSDFLLELVQRQDGPLVVRREKPTDGYSQHWCSYQNTDQDANVRRVLDMVFHELRPELRTFYEACRLRELLLRAWGKIEEPVRTSLLADGKGRWRDAIANRLRQSRSIRLVTDRLIRFEMDRLFERQSLRESVDHTYSVPGRAYLRDEVEKAAKDLGEYPVDEVYRLIEFLEGRRSKQVELLVVLIAAIVAGVAGGIAAWFLGPAGALSVS